jgi:hypothetical protein
MVQFLDPPYLMDSEHWQQNYYSVGFSESDHQRLAERPRHTSQPWVMTLGDHYRVWETYGGWTTIRPIAPRMLLLRPPAAPFAIASKERCPGNRRECAQTPNEKSMKDYERHDRSVWVQPADHKIVGACLAAARRRANLTQAELAARLDKPQSFASHYERCQRRIDLLEFLVIVRALGADPLEVFAEIAKATDG